MEEATDPDLHVLCSSFESLSVEMSYAQAAAKGPKQSPEEVCRRSVWLV